MHALDRVARVEQVGLPGARAAAAHVHPTDDAVGSGQHDRRAGQPAVAAPGGVADADAGHVGEGVGRTRADSGHAVVPVRKRRAASAYTRAQRTMSATSTNSSAWWAIHLPPGP